MSERIILFPFQEKVINDGEELPLADRIMEESETLDKWQMVGGAVLAVASTAIPVLAPVAAATLGTSLVSHEITRDELRIRQEKRRATNVEQELQIAA